MASEKGVYVTLEELVRIQYRATAFDFLPRQPVESLLSGRHASRMRGRGLNFEEIRAYLPGDDVRNIDWKVTARTREPHVRVYTEERDRPAIFVVDQRISMFFGSRRNMKSVTAVELAAAGAWRVLEVGDRVGSMVFDDTEVVEIRPHRSRATVHRVLETLVTKNRALRSNSVARRNPEMLDRVLEQVSRTARHDHLVAIVSDFDGLDADTRRHVTRLSMHNDVLVFLVLDPLATELPAEGRLVVSDGELQVELDVGGKEGRKRLAEVAGERLRAVLAWQEELGVPVLPISTDEDALDQARRLLGAA